MAYPKLRTIWRVELDRIAMPEWARAKAIRGLNATADAVWLGRIAGKVLANLDREAGGRPVVTETVYRRCPVCDRPLLGEEAQARWELDRTLTGRQVPCGPECLEVTRTLKQQNRRQGRQRNAGT